MTIQQEHEKQDRLSIEIEQLKTQQMRHKKGIQLNKTRAEEINEEASKLLPQFAQSKFNESKHKYTVQKLREQFAAKDADLEKKTLAEILNQKTQTLQIQATKTKDLIEQLKERRFQRGLDSKVTHISQAA